MKELQKEIWEMFENKEINNDNYRMGYNKAIIHVSALIDAKIQQREAQKKQAYIIKSKQL